jgi:hypothetical protein
LACHRGSRGNLGQSRTSVPGRDAKVVNAFPRFWAVNLSAEKRLSSKPFCWQIKQLTAFVGNSALTLNVTAPLWHDAKLKPPRRLADLVLGDPTSVFSVLKRELLSEHPALIESAAL